MFLLPYNVCALSFTVMGEVTLNTVSLMNGFNCNADVELSILFLFIFLFFVCFIILLLMLIVDFS